MSVKRLSAERGIEPVMSDPRVMELMSDPKVMNVAMQAFQIRGQAQASIDKKVKRLAKRLISPRRMKCAILKNPIKSLEETLQQMQKNADGGKTSKSSKSSSAPQSTAI